MFGLGYCADPMLNFPLGSRSISNLCKFIKSHPFGKSVWINGLIEPLLTNVVEVGTRYASAKVASMSL